jgi:hypothetical protein
MVRETPGSSQLRDAAWHIVIRSNQAWHWNGRQEKQHSGWDRWRNPQEEKGTMPGWD